MKEWLTAREISEAALSDVPRTESAVVRLAKRAGWNDHPAFARPRAGRGGGIEYSYRLLPSVAQVEWTRRHLAISADAANDHASAPPLPALPHTDRAIRERDARLAIVGAFERFSRGLPLSHMSRLQIFTDRYNTRSGTVDEWVKDLVPTISKRSLDRWRSARRDGKTIGADPGLSRKGTGVLDLANDGKVSAFILATIAQQPHLAAHQVRTQCRHQFGETLTVKGRQVTMPPVRAFQRVISAIKDTHHVGLTKLTNPDLYRSTMAPSGTGTYRYVTAPNALWMIDASPVDALCIDGRQTVYACIDIATRRLILLISRTPRASAVALLLRKAILAWGKPTKIKTDNGSDFVAEDTKRLFAALDIEMELSDAYSPQQKGHIERAIGTFQRDFSPLLPGYVGHSVADRKAIENRKSFAQRLGEKEAETFGVSLSGAELQVYADRWAETMYQHQPHKGLNDRTPAQVAAASKHTIQTVDERALDLLLMPVAGGDGRRIVTKFGVRIDSFHYVTPSILPGEAVFVRQDPNDLGRAFVFAANGAEFLGEALCAELRGIHPATLMKAKRETQTEMLDAATRQVKADMRELAKGPSLIEKALEVAARDVPNVIALPKRQGEHSTPQIAAALSAVTKRPAPKAVSSEVEQFQAQAAKQPSNVQPLRAAETMHQRFARALEIETRMKAGEPVEPSEAHWLGTYQTGSEYRTMRTIHEDLESQIGS